MIKVYSINGRLFRYEEGKQPEGAVEFKPVEAKAVPEVANKAVKKTANKSKGASAK